MSVMKRIMGMIVRWLRMLFGRLGIPPAPAAGYPVAETFDDDRAGCLAADMQDVARIFYDNCVAASDAAISQSAIVHRTIGGKAALATRALQLVFIRPQLPKYMTGDEADSLINNLLAHTPDQRDTLHCHDLHQCYLKMGGAVQKKHAYYFSVDIAKYILGYESEGFPSAFPCLSSYISSGIPRDILTRSSVTQVALAIQTLVPRLKVATDLAIAYCFHDESHVFEIDTDI